MSTELEQLVIRLVGEGKSYKKVIDDAVADTEQAVQEVTALTVDAQKAQDAAMEKAAAITESLKTPTEQYTQTVDDLRGMYEKGLISQATYNRGLQQATEQLPAVREAQEKYNREVKEAADVTRAAMSPTERYEEELKKLDKQLKSGHISAETHARSVRNLSREYGMGAHKVKAFGQSVRNVGLGIGAIGTGMTIGLTLPIVGAAASMVKAASDAEETQNKFGVVFRDVAAEAQAMADTLDESFGMSQVEAKKLLSDTGDLLSGFGFSGQQALELSGQVQQLAVDLASFTNVEGGAATASEALTKALLGEREMAKQLGISIMEEDVKAQMLINTQKGLTFETERQAKAFATLQLAQQQSANAIGDYARSADSFANQTRELWADITDLRVEFGQLMLPAVKAVVGVLRNAVAFMRSLSDGTKRVVLIVAGLVAGMGPLMVVIGGVIAVVGSLISAIAGLVAIGWPAIAAAAALAAKFALIAAAAAAVGAAIAGAVYYLVGPESLQAGFMAVLETAKRWAMTTIGFLYNFRHNLSVLLKWLPKNWQNVVKDMLRVFVTVVKNMILNIQVMVRTAIRLYSAWQGWMFNLFKQIFTVDFWKMVWDGIKKVSAIFLDFAKWAWNAIKSIFSGRGDTIQGFGQQLADDFKSGMEGGNIFATMGDIIKEEAANLQGPLEGFESSIEDAPDFSYEIGQQAGEALGDGVKDALDNSGADKVEEGMTKATAEMLEDIKKLEEKLEEQKATFGMTGAQAEIYKLQMRGATEEQLAHARALDEEIKALEEQKKLQDKATQLTKKHMTPLQKFTEGEEELNKMLQEGLIDTHTHTEAMKELRKEFEKEIRVKVTTSGVEATLAGTADALAKLNEYRAGLQDPLQAALPSAPLRGPQGSVITAGAGQQQNPTFGGMVADGRTGSGDPRTDWTSVLDYLNRIANGVEDATVVSSAGLN